jgi:hypothetical protein
MKSTSLTTIVLFFLFSMNIAAQENTTTANSSHNESSVSKKDRLNFFIVSKRKKGKLDPATRFNVFRTKIKSLFRPKSFVAIVAGDAQQASAKIIHRLKKYDASIGTIWFDSHGAFKKGYSLFYIGHDEISYHSLKDSVISNAFGKLASYSTYDTKLVIGSCYGGATYTRSSIDYKDTTRMNGDSLMMALGNLFQKGRVYGSESWVMTKPGLFNDKRTAVAGFPKRKLFHDVCYRPAWENIGKWNEYDASAKTFIRINTVTLDSYGNLELIPWCYNEKPDTQKDIRKNISKLEPDLYK